MVAPKNPIFKDWAGINNIDPPEKCKPGELQTASNVDIDDNRRILRREGYLRVYTGNVHSLWGNKEFALFREGTALKRLDSGLTTATTLRTGLIGNDRMAYLEIMGRVYYSDGIVTGIVDSLGAVNRTWGIEVPGHPILVESAGAMPEGRYFCTLTYVRDDGQESGALTSVAIDITMGGITVNNIPISSDPTVDWVNVYISTVNGEVLYLALVLPNGTTSGYYGGTTQEFNLPLRTMHLDPPPAGQNLQYYNGRIYIANDNVLWWTEPSGYEHINLAHNSIILDSRITLLAPVDDGIWIGTEREIDFIPGKDPQEFRRIQRSQYGAIEGTQTKLDDIGEKGDKINGWIWAARDGICLGMPQGAIKNISQARYVYTETKKGAALAREGDFNQYIVGLN